MKRTVKYLLIAAVGSLLVGCYNDFDNPTPAHIFVKADFEVGGSEYVSGMEYISPKDLKAEFKKNATGYSSEGANASWVVNKPYYTSGKVISNDRYGSVYKSLYLYDAASESAIEVRLTNGNYIAHPAGQIVYVKLLGLTMGNYRGMISIGSQDGTGKYANSTIEDKVTMKNHIFSGEQVGMVKSDTLVVNSTNYASLNDDALARLVRFEGVKSKFGKAEWGYANNFPNYFADADHSYDVTSPGWENFCKSGTATWAEKRKIVGLAGTTSLYGSAWFKYDSAPATNSADSKNIPAGHYVIRTSAYSLFWDGKITADGKGADVTALYTKFTNGTGAYVTYQLTLNNGSDVVEK